MTEDLIFGAVLIVSVIGVVCMAKILMDKIREKREKP